MPGGGSWTQNVALQMAVNAALFAAQVAPNGAVRVKVLCLCVIITCHHYAVAHEFLQRARVAMLFVHAFQPFPGASVYRNDDDFALLAVCSCYCSRTMVEEILHTLMIYISVGNYVKMAREDHSHTRCPQATLQNFHKLTAVKSNFTS